MSEDYDEDEEDGYNENLWCNVLGDLSNMSNLRYQIENCVKTGTDEEKLEDIEQEIANLEDSIQDLRKELKRRVKQNE